MSEVVKISLKDYSPIDDNKVLCQALQNKIDLGEYSIININGGDRWDRPTVFKAFNNGYWTQGYVGVLDYMDDESKRYRISIGSRFDNDKKQYFLSYVFSKVFNENGRIFKDMQVEGNSEKMWDMLLAISFLNHLKRTFRKGMFRVYRNFQYNDSKLKGSIDFARHMRANLLPDGNIAYNTREYTVNNHYNALILAAYEAISDRYPSLVRNILENATDIKSTIRTMKNDLREWQDVRSADLLRRTEKKIVHPVYRSYERLRVMSRMILRRMGINVMQGSRGSVSGVVIDMSKLWEEFCKNQFFPGEDWTLQYRKNVLNGHREFKPDLFNETKKIVVDAKYKASWGKTVGNSGKWEHVRDDVFQILAYMLSFECNVGGVIFPCADNLKAGILEPESVFPDENDTQNDKVFYRIPVYIPTGSKSYQKYAEEMKEQAESVKEEISNM